MASPWLVEQEKPLALANPIATRLRSAQPKHWAVEARVASAGLVELEEPLAVTAVEQAELVALTTIQPKHQASPAWDNAYDMTVGMH